MRALIVDDSPVMRKVVERALRQAGIELSEVLNAGNGTEALEVLRHNTEHLDLIVSDINMPGMDGLALLQEIKKRWPKLPVMMLTAYDDNERRRRAADSGAADFVTKPVDFDVLKTRLRQLHGPSV